MATRPHLTHTPDPLQSTRQQVIPGTQVFPPVPRWLSAVGGTVFPDVASLFMAGPSLPPCVKEKVREEAHQVHAGFLLTAAGVLTWFPCGLGPTQGRTQGLEPWRGAGQRGQLLSPLLISGVDTTLQADSLPAEPQGSPRILEWVAYPFSRVSASMFRVGWRALWEQNPLANGWGRFTRKPGGVRIFPPLLAPCLSPWSP